MEGRSYPCPKHQPSQAARTSPAATCLRDLPGQMILPANQFLPVEGVVVTGQDSDHGMDFSYLAHKERNERVVGAVGASVEFRRVVIEIKSGKLSVPEEESFLATPEEASGENALHRDFQESSEMEIGRTFVEDIRQFTCQSSVKFTNLHSKLHLLV